MAKGESAKNSENTIPDLINEIAGIVDKSPIEKPKKKKKGIIKSGVENNVVQEKTQEQKNLCVALTNKENPSYEEVRSGLDSYGVLDSSSDNDKVFNSDILNLIEGIFYDLTSSEPRSEEEIEADVREKFGLVESKAVSDPKTQTTVEVETNPDMPVTQNVDVADNASTNEAGSKDLNNSEDLLKVRKKRKSKPFEYDLDRMARDLENEKKNDLEKKIRDENQQDLEKAALREELDKAYAGPKPVVEPVGGKLKNKAPIVGESPIVEAELSYEYEEDDPDLRDFNFLTNEKDRAEYLTILDDKKRYDRLYKKATDRAREEMKRKGLRKTESKTAAYYYEKRREMDAKLDPYRRKIEWAKEDSLKSGKYYEDKKRELEEKIEHIENAERLGYEIVRRNLKNEEVVIDVDLLKSQRDRLAQKAEQAKGWGNIENWPLVGRAVKGMLFLTRKLVAVSDKIYRFFEWLAASGEQVVTVKEIRKPGAKNKRVASPDAVKHLPSHDERNPKTWVETPAAKLPKMDLSKEVKIVSEKVGVENLNKLQTKYERLSQKIQTMREELVPLQEELDERDNRLWFAKIPGFLRETLPGESKTERMQREYDNKRLEISDLVEYRDALLERIKEAKKQEAIKEFEKNKKEGPATWVELDKDLKKKSKKRILKKNKEVGNSDSDLDVMLVQKADSEDEVTAKDIISDELPVEDKEESGVTESITEEVSQPEIKESRLFYVEPESFKELYKVLDEIPKERTLHEKTPYWVMKERIKQLEEQIGKLMERDFTGPQLLEVLSTPKTFIRITKDEELRGVVQKLLKIKVIKNRLAFLKEHPFENEDVKREIEELESEREKILAGK